MDQKATRGKKWTDDEIKSMLQVALEININELFDSHQLSNGAIFKELGKKFTDKDVNQIKIKYDSLRRWFCFQCSDAKKSGAAAIKKTIFDDEMFLLWGKRKKITVPIEFGIDTSEVLDITEYVETTLNSEISNESSSNFEDPDIAADDSLTPVKRIIKSGKKKTKQQHDMDSFLQKLKEQDAAIMTQMTELQEKSEKKADERLNKFLNALPGLMCQSSSNGYPNLPMYFAEPRPRPYQIFVPSPSSSTATSTYTNSSFGFEEVLLEENLIEED